MKKMTHLIHHAKDFRRDKGRTLVGAFLAMMGFFWLSKKAGWIPTEIHEASLFWPIVVMAIGVMLLVSQHARARHEGQR